MTIKAIVTAASMALFAAPAAASLVVDVTGTVGSGTTYWAFSGSTTALGGGAFSVDDNFSPSNQFNNVGEFTDLDTFDVPGDGGSVSGIVQMTVGGDSRNIDSVFVDSDTGTNADDIAFGVDGASDFSFSNGDVVSWTGVLTVNGIDMSNLILGGDPNTLTGLGINEQTNLALTVNIDGTPVSTVPLPAGFGLLLSGLGGVVGLKRRSKKRAV